MILRAGHKIYLQLESNSGLFQYIINTASILVLTQYMGGGYCIITINIHIGLKNMLNYCCVNVIRENSRVKFIRNDFNESDPV